MSAKYSIPDNGSSVRLAAGALYMTLPVSGTLQGSGVSFGTATFGDAFNHYSASFGLGFTNIGDGWSFSKNPLFVLAGNNRINKSASIVFEFWKFPFVPFEFSPLMLAYRFIGRKFSVDFGIITSKFFLTAGVPVPLLNFTYHM